MVVYENSNVRQLKLYKAKENGDPNEAVPSVNLMGVESSYTDEMKPDVQSSTYYNVFLHEISGLGLSNDVKTTDLGFGFFHDQKNTKYKAETISGDLLFLPPYAYAHYRNFVNYVQSAEYGLLLAYKPYKSSETYYCKCTIESLQKEELEMTGVLTVPVSFIPLTPWYQKERPSFRLEGLSGNEMKYNAPLDNSHVWYDDVAAYGSSLLGSYVGEISAKGHIPGAITLTTDEEMSNPILTLSEKNNPLNVYGELEIESDQSLVEGLNYSSRHDDSFIKDGLDNNLLEMVDPMSDPYIRIPTYGTYEIRLRADNELTDPATITIYYFYRSV